MKGAFDWLLDRVDRRTALIICEYVSGAQWIGAGSDCQVPIVLRDRNARSSASPFDWNLTLGRVSSIFESDFTGWTTVGPGRKSGERSHNRYGVYFAHDADPMRPDDAKYGRRIERLKTALRLIPTATDDDPVVHIIRMSHKSAHEGGCPRCSARMDGPDIDGMNLDEIGDWLAFDRFLQRIPAPRPRYKLWLLLVCSRCYSAKTVVPTATSACEIINLTGIRGITAPSTNEQINAVVDKTIGAMLLRGSS